MPRDAFQLQQGGGAQSGSKPSSKPTSGAMGRLFKRAETEKVEAEVDEKVAVEETTT
jgi:hypothetical protein